MHAIVHKILKLFGGALAIVCKALQMISKTMQGASSITKHMFPERYEHVSQTLKTLGIVFKNAKVLFQNARNSFPER